MCLQCIPRGRLLQPRQGGTAEVGSGCSRQERLLVQPSPDQAPKISFRPSTILSSSSGETRPILFLRRSRERVRTWLTFTQDRFGSSSLVSSTVRGKPAF